MPRWAGLAGPCAGNNGCRAGRVRGSWACVSPARQPGWPPVWDSTEPPCWNSVLLGCAAWKCRIFRVSRESCVTPGRQPGCHRCTSAVLSPRGDSGMEISVPWGHFQRAAGLHSHCCAVLLGLGASSGVWGEHDPELCLPGTCAEVQALACH